MPTKLFSPNLPVSKTILTAKSYVLAVEFSKVYPRPEIPQQPKNARFLIKIITYAQELIKIIYLFSHWNFNKFISSRGN